MSKCLLLTFCLLLQGPTFAQRRLAKVVSTTNDLSRYVNPFIGTAGHGHTFPGATVPFGMVQLSPDTRLTGWDGCSGYHYSDSKIYGFSHTHLSGTGISDYGDILFLPTTGDAAIRVEPVSFKHENEKAGAGWYTVKLDNDVLVELTTTKRVGFHRYTFPPSDTGNIILDLAHRDRVLDSSLKILDRTHLVGYRRSTAWARNQIVYFAAEFSRPFRTFQATSDNGTGLGELHGKDIKAAFTFSNTSHEPLLLKVGISAVSIEGAQKNLQAEISNWNFERVRAQAIEDWNFELNKIQVAGGTEEQLETFYTALYHAASAPNLFNDVDGKYLGHDFKVHDGHGFDNYSVFSLWDTFRAAHPLYTIIDQKRTADFINTFLTQYQEGGRLPVWELAANETDTMIGYHAASIIADAIVKGITGFDQELAFSAMKHSAEMKHYGLDSYIEQGFIPLESERESVSKTLEYAYDDWCIAQVGKKLGHEYDYERYMRRAQSYKNVFDPGSAFVRPRTNAGWLEPFDPREVNFSFTEANSWQYSFFAPQDISGLIELMGGEKKFAEKLDELFTTDSKTTGRDQADITGLIGQYAHGNEPSHHVAYLYNYVGQPWKTQSRVRQILDNFYKAEPDGLIGNEDCGQMSAWYVLSAAGFYPVTPGGTIYAIGTPLFPEIRFQLENGKSFTIKANRVSSLNFYIQSAKLNGKDYRKSYLQHEDLLAGGELVFEMGDKPNTIWATEAPVSRITTEQIVAVPVVKAAGKTFQSKQKISLEGQRNTNLYYTSDGSEPTVTSNRYVQPFVIEATTTIKARAVDNKGHASQIAVATFLKMPHAWTLTLNSKYSNQYPGGGDYALVDGIRGSTNFGGGAWQGYQGKDLVAIVDLGRVQTISKVTAGFLQDVGSWIVMPRQVEFEISLDGKNFEPALSVVTDVNPQKYEAITRDIGGPIKPVLARYIKLKAQNFGKLPAWHPGAGGDSWIFVDEIIIE